MRSEGAGDERAGAAVDWFLATVEARRELWLRVGMGVAGEPDVEAVVADTDGRWCDVRLVLGAVAPTPWRLRAVEAALTGTRPTVADVRRLVDAELDRHAHPLPRNGWKLDAAAGLVEQAYDAFWQEASKSGVILAGEALEGPDTATAVQVRNGERLVTDGPFAETKEQLGGFYLVECKDLDEAIEWAAKIPGAQNGTIEVRPVVNFEQ